MRCGAAVVAAVAAPLRLCGGGGTSGASSFAWNAKRLPREGRRCRRRRCVAASSADATGCATSTEPEPDGWLRSDRGAVAAATRLAEGAYLRVARLPMPAPVQPPTAHRPRHSSRRASVCPPVRPAWWQPPGREGQVRVVPRAPALSSASRPAHTTPGAVRADPALPLPARLSPLPSHPAQWPFLMSASSLGPVSRIGGGAAALRWCALRRKPPPPWAKIR